MLDPLELMPTMAEVSIAFAGVSALLVVVKRLGAGGSWLAAEIVALHAMILGSLGAFFFSLLPFPLVYLGATTPTAFLVCNLALAAYLLSVQFWIIPGAARRRGATPRAPGLRWVYAPVVCAMAIALMASFWAPAIRGGIFTLGLIMLLLFAAIPLIIFLTFVESRRE